MSASPLTPPALPSWLSAQLPFRRAMVRVGDFVHHVMEAGPETGRPVLLLHGNPTWGFLWRKTALALQGTGLRLVMPDLVGLGLSEHPSAAAVHTLDFHAKQIAGLLAQLDLRDVLLVVQDWGGPIGGCAAADSGDRVTGLVVLNTALTPPRPGFKPTRFHRFSQLPVLSDLVFRLGNFPARLGMAMAQGDKASVAGDVGRAYRWVLRDRRTNVAPLALARLVPDSLEHPSVPRLRDCEAWVRGFTGPSAIVWGRKDPVLGRLLKRTKELLPNAPVTETDAGHFLQEEVPGPIAEAIRQVAAS